MKTVTNGVIVKRMDDQTAKELVQKGTWWFCPKSIWKAIERHLMTIPAWTEETK